jgi:hypothetical protein
MSDKNRDTILLALIFVLPGLAAVTLLPFSGAKTNDLGYSSLCTFVPWSTLTLLLAAAVIWVLRQYLATRSK